MRLADLRAQLQRRRADRRPELVEWPAEPFLRAADPVPLAPEPPCAVAAAPPEAWTKLRLDIVERLWGEGFVAPGGGEELMRLALPLGLSGACSLLLLGAGSGGPALRIAGELGTWVQAYEAEPMLAAVAARRVQQGGPDLARRAAIVRWDPLAPAFRRRAFHHALVLDALRGPRIEDGVAAIALALRPGAQIAMVQTVAGPGHDPSDPALRTWQRLEGRDGPFADPAVVQRTLEGLGYDPRVAEDVSARLVRSAIAGWRSFLPRLDAERPDPVQAGAIVAEAERWLRRVRLIRAGRLRVMRWLALHRP
jgi:phosphoethanolamine N-methyltransferase